MADEDRLAREWVEIREECTASRMVLRPIDYPIPPARGRRHLALDRSGRGSAIGPGASDRPEAKGGGVWSLSGSRLHLTIEGWKGDYDIEELKDELLVLRTR